jgi:hypothetical protein
MSFSSFYYVEGKDDEFDVVDDDQVYIDQNFDLEVDDVLKKDLDGEDDEEDDKEDLTEAKTSRQKRQSARSKRSAINKATKGQFYKSSLKSRAKFLSRYEFKQVTPTSGIFLPRKKPLPQLKVYRRLRKASKVLKKFSRIRTKGKQSKRRTKGKF